MIFLADAGVERLIVEFLRQAGHVVHYVAEMQPGIPDDIVLEMSSNVGALLLTADKDFGELVFRQNRLATGVILIRLAGLSSAEKATIVVDVIKRHASEVEGSFTVITRGAVRIRSRFR